MSKSKAKSDQQALRYKTADLLRSKALSGYQKDFVKVILTAPDYTIEEAKAAIEAVLGHQ